MGSQILRSFYSDLGREFTIKEVQGRSGLSYKPVYFGLMKLAEQGYLDHRREKWKHYFRLNVTNTFVRKELEVFGLERREQKLSSLSESLRSGLEILIERAQEQVPLLCSLLLDSREGEVKVLFVVAESNGHAARLKKLASEMGLVYGVTFSPVTASLKVFRHILSRPKEELGALVESATPLFGTEFYMREKFRHLAELREAAKSVGESTPEDRRAPPEGSQGRAPEAGGGG